MVVRKSEGYTLLILEIFIIILNTLAIIVIKRFKKKCNPDILILTLAVADLIKAFIPLNLSLVAYLGGVAMTESSPKCIIFGWTAFTVNSSIMLVMTIMAIDRYVAICWPFEYKYNLTKKRLIYAIIAVFVFSGVHSILPFVGVGRMRSYYNGSFCHFDFDSTVPASLGYSVFVLVLGISMLVVVIFCYTRAMLSIRGLIRRQRRMSNPSRDFDGADRKRQSMNHMFARLMIVMMIAFCISWLLFLIVVLQHVSGWFVLPSAAHFWSMRLAVLNSLLNPIIGAAMCKPYRKGYMFILCKCLHYCCGICSSYKAENPWISARKFSTGSRHSSERDQNEPNKNDTVRSRIRNNPSFNSCQDSGIVPDSNDCTGSPRYDEDGVFNDAFDSGGGSRFPTRPRLFRKRISFKDEFDGQKIEEMSLSEEKAAEPLTRMPDDTTVPDQHPIPSLPNTTKYGPVTNQDVNNETENTSNGNQFTSVQAPTQGKDSRMTAVSSNGNQGRKHGISGIDQSLLERTSLGRPPGSSDTLLTSGSDAPLREGHRTEEKTTHGEKTVLENTVSQLMIKDEQATASYLPKGLSGDKSEKEKSLRELAIGALHLISPRESSFESVQITHFPVGTNSGIKTTTVKSPVLKNSQSCGVSPFSLRSGSFIDRTPKLSLQNQKARSRSFAYDCLVSESDNTRQERHDSFERQPVIRSPTTQRAHAAEGLFDAPRYKSGEILPSTFSPNFGRAKSFDSMLDNTRFKSDSTSYGGPDLTSFQRHSSVFKGAQLNPPCNWYSSEPDLTRTLQETVFLTSPYRSPHRNSGPHSEPYEENVHNSYQRRASSPQVTSLSPIKSYVQLTELSQKEQEREVFC